MYLELAYLKFLSFNTPDAKRLLRRWLQSWTSNTNNINQTLLENLNGCIYVVYNEESIATTFRSIGAKFRGEISNFEL